MDERGAALTAGGANCVRIHMHRLYPPALPKGIALNVNVGYAMVSSGVRLDFMAARLSSKGL
jgi:hypothetical protein